MDADGGTLTVIQTNVVIFGADTFASLAWYCLTHDSDFRVVGFTVDAAYLRAGSHHGLPVVPFEALDDFYSPGEVGLLIPLGYRAINGLRRARYESARARGYPLVSYVSSRASIWPDLQVGGNCLIYEQAVIQPFARIGDNVIVRSAAHVSHHCRLGDHVFVAAGATFGGNVTVEEQVFIGLGAVIRDGVTLGPRSFVGAGAVVVADTLADGVYVGNPARRGGRTSLEVTGGGKQ